MPLKHYDANGELIDGACPCDALGAAHVHIWHYTCPDCGFWYGNWPVLEGPGPVAIPEHSRIEGGACPGGAQIVFLRFEAHHLYGGMSARA